MKPTRIDREAGRHLFGGDPEAYDHSRPDYPPRVYEILVERCGLHAGARVLEIGAGSGLATRRLAELGARPIVAIEPDARLARYLARTSAEAGLDVSVLEQPFEEIQLGRGAFDLAVSATAFHWVDQAVGLRKVAALLRPGGGWAMWWTVFGDPERPDAFQEASGPLFDGLLLGPSHSRRGGKPFALDVEARLADLAAARGFTNLEHELLRWTAQMDPSQIRALYSTFSTVAVLPEDKQRRLLDQLAELVVSRFSGRVERRFVTSIYTALRTD